MRAGVGPVSRCECHLDLEPPSGATWWMPTLDDDPGPSVQAVVRCGEAAELRRAVRREDGAGWSEYGAMVDYYHDLTPPMGWERVGTCWAEKPHPVVAVCRDENGRWLVVDD